MENERQICFLIGAPRSGTTWMQRLLQSHPKIFGGEESYFFSFFAHPLREAPQLVSGGQRLGPLSYIGQEKFEKSIKNLWYEIFSDVYKLNPPECIHLEKTPHHAFYIDDIVKFFPSAKIIFLSRDSRAVVSSLLHASRSWGKHWAPTSHKDAAILWWRYAKAYTDWKANNPSHPSLMIRYEDALVDTEGTLRIVLEFLFGKFTEEEVKETLRNFENSLATRKDPEGFNRIRGIDGWKKDLSLYGRFVTWRYTRKMMRELGYDIRPFG